MIVKDTLIVTICGENLNMRNLLSILTKSTTILMDRCKYVTQRLKDIYRIKSIFKYFTQVTKIEYQ